jgi:hypothetical protein
VVGVAGATLLGLALLSDAFVGLFSRYTADDYCTAGQVVANGLVGMAVGQYTGWSGRFSFLFMVGLVESIGAWLVPLLPTLGVVGLTAAAAWTIRQLHLTPHIPLQLLLALVIAGATLGSTPDLSQSLFWQTGMLTYLAPLILGLIYVGLLRRAVDQPRPVGGWSLVAAGLLCFIAGGSSETYVAVQTAGLALGIALCLLLSSRETRASLLPLLGVGLAGSIAAMLLIVGAPGNGTRESGHPAPNLVFALGEAVDDTQQFVHIFFRFSTVWAAVAFGVPALVACLPASRHRPRSLPARAGILLLLAAVVFVLLTFAFVPSFYALSSPAPGRARIIPQLVLLCGLACAGWAVGSQVRASWPRLLSPAALGAAALVAVALVAVASLPGLRQSFADTTSAREFASRWDTIDRQIRSDRAQGERDVRVPTLAMTGNIHGMDFLATDPADWLNQCAARYYRVDSLATNGN